MNEPIRYIKKVSYKDKRTEIHFEQHKKVKVDGGKTETLINRYTLESSDDPRQEFKDALKDLAIHVCQVCEIPEDQEPKITVTGVSFSYGGDDMVMGATIIAQKKLSKSSAPLNIVTPHKPSAPYAEDADKSNVMDSSLTCALEIVLEEAGKYIDFDRESQLTLFPIAQAA